MSRSRLRRLTAAIALLAMLGTGAKAAESAAGAYVLGIRGPGAGMTPPTGLFFSNQMFTYSVWFTDAPGWTTEKLEALKRRNATQPSK